MGTDPANKILNAFAIADVQRFVLIGSAKLADQPLEAPTRIAFRTKKNGSIVVVYAYNFESCSAEINCNFRTDQPARPCDQDAFFSHSIPDRAGQSASLRWEPCADRHYTMGQTKVRLHLFLPVPFYRNY